MRKREKERESNWSDSFFFCELFSQLRFNITMDFIFCDLYCSLPLWYLFLVNFSFFFWISYEEIECNSEECVCVSCYCSSDCYHVLTHMWTWTITNEIDWVVLWRWRERYLWVWEGRMSLSQMPISENISSNGEMFEKSEIVETVVSIPTTTSYLGSDWIKMNMSYYHFQKILYVRIWLLFPSLLLFSVKNLLNFGTFVMLSKFSNNIRGVNLWMELSNFEWHINKGTWDKILFCFQM
jgi:hypothetical protein